jgi:hypothetical protein
VKPRFRTDSNSVIFVLWEQYGCGGNCDFPFGSMDIGLATGYICAWCYWEP